MKNKVLVLSIYPAPYRVNLFKLFSDAFDLDVFFEHSGGDQRNAEWFEKGEYYLLDTEEGKNKYKKVRVRDYDFVAVFDYSSVTAIKLILECKKHNVPYAINCDGVIMESHGNFLRECIKRFLVKGASAYFASGENAKNYFIKYGAKEDKIVIHTFSELEQKDILDKPVSSEEKIELRKTLGLPTNKKIAIAVGRFIPLKRYGELIQTWKDMPDDYILLLIGGGSEKDSYMRIIEDNNINNVIIGDFLTKDKLFDYYKASDVFVHPTSYDVWGLVVNEAMACGLPVVVSDRCVAGIELIKNGENGYLIKTGDENALCEKVKIVLNNEVLYKKMSENVLKTIITYTLDNMADIQISAIKEKVPQKD